MQKISNEETNLLQNVILLWSKSRANTSFPGSTITYLRNNFMENLTFKFPHKV